MTVRSPEVHLSPPRTSERRVKVRRSGRSADYQDVPRPVVGLAHEFPSGFVDPPHAHKRAQLLYVAAGVVQVTTDGATFVLPAHRAAWIPAGVTHEVRCVGNVSGRTLYVEAHACDDEAAERLWAQSAKMLASG